MNRLTTDDSQSILYGLNLFFVKDGEVWIRGGGPEPDYQDCTLVDYIGRVAETHHLDIVSRDAEHLGDEMYDCLQYGTDELEGVVALLHAAAIQAAEMRGRLADIEDILGDSYDLDRLEVMVNQCMTMRDEVAERFSITAKIPIARLRELVEADRKQEFQRHLKRFDIMPPKNPR